MRRGRVTANAMTSRTLDLLACNAGAMALYSGIEDWPAAQRNIGRFLFLHPAARVLYADWDNQIRGCVARLRALAGTDPDAPDLAALVGELLLKSPDFADWQTRNGDGWQLPYRMDYLGELTLVVPSAASVKHYADIVGAHAMRRRLIGLLRE